MSHSPVTESARPPAGPAGRRGGAVRAFAAATLCVGLAAAPALPAETNARPARWAAPLVRDGLPNFYKVSDELYRGAQPTEAGMRELRKMGIRTVVNLRSFHSDRDEIGDAGFATEHIFMKAWRPEEEDIVRFLRIATDKARVPVFVHCQHGADRTGVMCAAYRIVAQGWTPEEAAREMVEGGFGFHPLWRDIPPFVRGLDADALRARLAGAPGGRAPAAAPPAPAPEAAKTPDLESLLRDLVLDRIELRDAPLPEAAKALTDAIRAAGGADLAGVQVVLQLPPRARPAGGADPFDEFIADYSPAAVSSISLSLRGVGALDAIRRIAEAAGLSYRFAGRTVVWERRPGKPAGNGPRPAP